jgi:cAMP-binding proteins - catabolite gene activator and regulatory subunit of cAMP-dependent protein kinases
VKINNLPFQQDIANMAGTSRETVSRTFKLLEEKGLLSRKGRQLLIYNFSQFSKTFS